MSFTGGRSKIDLPTILHKKKKGGKKVWCFIPFELVDPADADSLRQRSHLGLRRRSQTETVEQDALIYQVTVEQDDVGAFTFFGRRKPLP